MTSPSTNDTAPAVSPSATPIEKRLARRIHNQRRRLRQLENFWEARTGDWRRWMNIALERGRYHRALREENKAQAAEIERLKDEIRRLSAPGPEYCLAIDEETPCVCGATKEGRDPVFGVCQARKGTQP